MNLTQTAGILATAAGFDRFITLDDLNTNAWHLVLEPYEFEDVQQSVVVFYRDMWDGKTQLTPRALLDDVKARIRSDVKVAKSIGLIDHDWPELERLPVDVHDDLTTYREARQRYTASYGDAAWCNDFGEWFRSHGYSYKTKAIEA